MLDQSLWLGRGRLSGSTRLQLWSEHSLRPQNLKDRLSRSGPGATAVLPSLAVPDLQLEAPKRPKPDSTGLVSPWEEFLGSLLLCESAPGNRASLVRRSCGSRGWACLAVVEPSWLLGARPVTGGRSSQLMQEVPGLVSSLRGVEMISGYDHDAVATLVALLS